MFSSDTCYMIDFFSLFVSLASFLFLVYVYVRDRPTVVGFVRTASSAITARHSSKSGDIENPSDGAQTSSRLL